MPLDRLGITVAFPCVLCNKNLESSSHLFLHCDFAYDSWNWLLSKLGLSDVIGKDLASHFHSHPLMFSSSFCACVWVISQSIIIWNIWLEQNKMIFKKVTSLVSEVLHKIGASISEVALSYIYKNLGSQSSFLHWDSRITRVWGALSTLPSHGSISKSYNSLAKRALTKWKPSPWGHFKLNFDGASQGNPGKAGVGMAIFDHNAHLILAKCHDLGYITNNFAEFQALSLGLDMTISLKIKNIVIEGDSMVIIQSVMKNKSNCWKLQYLLDQIL
ncbi:uncharacterized protein LOC131876742 [Cryptomeria japonica]|uniref:uncharacterized protein LOC131876742 n=1 Tax=Cryptomeria japonica TaxID=3369 RepID=UPI0027D9DB10|nr:uncharacterized protein LOC131876742 [Cryptomeria japonica]